MGKLENRVVTLEQARQPPHAAMIAKFDALILAGERMPKQEWGRRLSELINTLNDVELTLLIEHLDNDLAS